MKKIIVSLCVWILFSSYCLGQIDAIKLDGFKYAFVENFQYGNDPTDTYGISNYVKNTLSEVGVKILDNDVDSWPIDAKFNRCLVGFWHVTLTGNYKLSVIARDCMNEIVYENSKSAALNWTNEFGSNLRRALGRALKPVIASNYHFLAKYTPSPSYPEVERDLEGEDSLREYYTSQSIDPVEGIYKTVESGSTGYYKIGIKKFAGKYKVIVLESDFGWWRPGDIKAYLELTAVNSVFSSKWYKNDKIPIDALAKLKDESLLIFEYANTNGSKVQIRFIKLFPNSNQIRSVSKNVKAYGSGFLVSKEGIIATNAHVVEGANKISITFENDTGKSEYPAKVLLIDKQNDVALLQIDHKSFNGLPTIPYTIVGNAEIGERVYTIGYPLNGVMGTNFKVNDGIISSKSGIDDDIRYYQISVPLQPGNSGGPLFNKDGNIIGITSGKLNSKAVGTDIQNVDYAIKAVYLLNLYNMLPNTENMSSDPKLKLMDMKDQIRVLKNYVCLIAIN